MKETSTEGAPNSGTQEISKERSNGSMLKCDPARLPKPPRPATKSHDESQETKTDKTMLKDYFYHAKMRSVKRGNRR